MREAPSLMTTSKPNAARTQDTECHFFAQGRCSKGSNCRFSHSEAVGSQRPQPPSGPIPTRGARDAATHSASSDSRAEIPCKFLAKPGGCQNNSCPYLHPAVSDPKDQSQAGTSRLEDSSDHEDDLTRELAGASVQFSEGGQVLRVSFPSDFAPVKINGLAPHTTVDSVVDLLFRQGYKITPECIKLLPGEFEQGRSVVVKSGEPFFAENLSKTFEDNEQTLSAVAISTGTAQSNARKVYVSWHRPSRHVFLNFGRGEIARRVAQKFNNGTYRCLGRVAKSSNATESSSRRGGYNANAWTIKLSHVPAGASRHDIETAVYLGYDKPRHIELGPVSYYAHDAEVSIEVRSHLEKYGPLESFYLSPMTNGRRVKVTACFQSEADASASCSSNGHALKILGMGKITVTQVQSLKVKIVTRIYQASRDRIQEATKEWKEQSVSFHVYQNETQHLTTLKLEGRGSEDLATARRSLDTILSGRVLEDDQGKVIWDSNLHSNGTLYKSIKLLEQELDVIIVRDGSRRQLKFYGPDEKYAPTVLRIRSLLTVTAAAHEIRLSHDQFSSAIRGGFNTIVQELGPNVATFDVVSRRIAINGAKEQYEKAVQILNRNFGIQNLPPHDDTASTKVCPICFDQPESPTQMSCQHIYCLDCLENSCASAASTSQQGFQIKCYGDGGDCPAIFTLKEVGSALSTSVLEDILLSSFSAFVQQKPDHYRYCPTPDCGFIYRCAPPSGLRAAARHTCPNCFEDGCRACHARHGQYTCAEYKDIASGGYVALAKLMKELKIKNCPRCATMMEKTEGCNHMTCPGCRAHICWVCLADFDDRGPCYGHMSKEHGGWGLDVWDG